MLAYMRKIQDAERRDDGASAVEYALLIAAVAAVLVAAVFLFTNFVADIFEGTEDQICSAEGDPIPGCEEGEPAP